MTGRSATRLVFPLTLEWSAEIGDKAKKEGVVATPITHEGRVYVGAQNGRFASLDLQTGKIVWRAEKKGYTVRIGGKWGRRPLVGTLFAEFLPEEQVVDFIAAVLDWYKEKAQGQGRIRRSVSGSAIRRRRRRRR